MNSDNPQEAFNKFNKTQQMNEFLGLSSALDNIIADTGQGRLDPSRIKQSAIASCQPGSRSNPLCKLLKNTEPITGPNTATY